VGYSQNSLISAIYEMALGRSNWDNILDILGATFPDCLVVVTGHDLVRRNSLLFAHRGLSADGVSAYLSGFADRNPWLPGVAELAPFQLFHDDQLMSRAEAAATPFVTEWLARQGDYLAGTGVVILREGPRQMAIEVRYPLDNQEVRERAAAVLGEAAYHFGRAFEILKRARFSSGFGYLDNVVEDLPFAVFFVDADMRIHYSNQQAEAMRRLGDGPFVGFGGDLRASDDSADRLLREVVQKTASAKRFPTSVLQLKAAIAEQKFLAIARAASRGQQHYQLHDAILDPGPLVMLVVHGSLDLASLPMDLLWRAFGLTESEATLAEALLTGSTLADFAQARAVSKQTLRNQLVGVMRKTGTRRQSELVSLLTRLSLTCL
jgi:DNA-binding CsgD family transcriptional regulator/PAS domain-containing protein